ncbi:hypothetical protein Tco_1475767 [Tanacetum coccineum]
MLTPKSTRALSKQKSLIKQGKVKLPGSLSFRGMALLICEAPQASVMDMAYWLDPIRCIKFESVLIDVEIDLTWSLGFLFVELVLIDAPWYLPKIAFVPGMKDWHCSFDSTLEQLLYIPLLEKDLRSELIDEEPKIVDAEDLD